MPHGKFPIWKSPVSLPTQVVSPQRLVISTGSCWALASLVSTLPRSPRRELELDGTTSFTSCAQGLDALRVGLRSSLGSLACVVLSRDGTNRVGVLLVVQHGQGVQGLARGSRQCGKDYNPVPDALGASDRDAADHRKQRGDGPAQECALRGESPPAPAPPKPGILALRPRAAPQSSTLTPAVSPSRRSGISGARRR